MTTADRTTTVPFLDLRAAQGDIAVELDAAWRSVTERASYVGGDLVSRFEEQWAAFCGTQHSIGVGNGTDAIELVLRGLGIGPGDEVIVPANTFIATAEAVVAVGATPLFVDVDPRTLLVTAETVRAGITPRTAAVLVVHLFGQVADVPSILGVTGPAGLPVIEDAAQAHGGTWASRRAGSLGVAGCFSFYPGKNLGAFGDGGAITTDDTALAERIRSLADHGRIAGQKYEHGVIGRNSRLDALQAAVLSVKLPRLDAWNADRRRSHEAYTSLLDAVPAAVPVHLDPRTQSALHLEVIRAPHRDRLREDLARRGVETGIHYPVPCHQHRPYAHFPRTALPHAEAAASEILSLPMYPGLGVERVERVCHALRDLLRYEDAAVLVGQPSGPLLGVPDAGLGASPSPTMPMTSSTTR